MAQAEPSENDFNPFHPGGVIAGAGFVLLRTRDEFLRELRNCDEFQTACESRGTLPEDPFDFLRFIDSAGRIWNPSDWSATEYPWSELPREREVHQLAIRFYEASRKTILKVAAYAGLSGCQRLLIGPCEECAAAWIELETALPKVSATAGPSVVELLKTRNGKKPYSEATPEERREVSAVLNQFLAEFPEQQRKFLEAIHLPDDFYRAAKILFDIDPEDAKDIPLDNFWREAQAVYERELWRAKVQAAATGKQKSSSPPQSVAAPDEDEIAIARQICKAQPTITREALRNQMEIGPAKAGKLIDIMREEGFHHSKKRKPRGT